MPSTWFVGADEYRFVQWDDMSTDPTRVVSLTADTTITVYYEYVPKEFALTVNSSPVTGIDFAVDGVTHTTNWSDLLQEGPHTIIMPVTWTTDTGDVYNFDHWELDGVNVGDPNPIEVTMDADHTLHAVFSEMPPLTVEVSADPTTVYSGGTPTINLTSDKGGTFFTVADHANGTYTATFTAPNITTQTTCTITADVSKSGYTSGSGQTQVTVQPLVLNIYVKDADGNPIADATVDSTAQPSGQAALSGTTDANGLVVFTGILKGSYTIKASKTGYEDKTGTVTLIAGQATTDTVTLSKLAEAPGFPLIWIAIAVILIAVVTVGAVFAVKKTRTPKP